MSKKAFDISLVLPSYQNAHIARHSLPRLMDHLNSGGLEYEVIVVDDGSDDGGATRRIALAHGCRYESFDHNRGKGAAVRRGMLAARGRYRIFTDMDIPYGLASIERCYLLLSQHGFLFAAGDRTRQPPAPGLRPSPLRQVASWIFATITQMMIAPGLTDTQCGLKGFQGHIARDLFSTGTIDGFAFDVELFFIARERSYPIGRLPVRLCRNEASTINAVRDGWSMTKDLWSIRKNHRLGRYEADAT